MNRKSPSKTMSCLEKALAAWKDFAPDKTFGGKQLSEFQAAVTVCLTNRSKIVDSGNEMKGLLVTREAGDLIALLIRELLVNAVVGDPDFGPNSAFYEALGYIRKDDRKSGLTRKKKAAPKDRE